MLLLILVAVLALDYALGFSIVLVGLAALLHRYYHKSGRGLWLPSLVIVAGVVQLIDSLPYLLNKADFRLLGFHLQVVYSSLDTLHALAGLALLAVAIIGLMRDTARTTRQWSTAVMVVLAAGLAAQSLGLVQGAGQQAAGAAKFQAQQLVLAKSIGVPIYQVTWFPSSSPVTFFYEFHDDALPTYSAVAEVNNDDDQFTVMEFNATMAARPHELCPTPDITGIANPNQAASTDTCVALGTVDGNTVYGDMVPDGPNSSRSRLQNVDIIAGSTHVIISHYGAISGDTALRMAASLKPISYSEAARTAK